MTYTFTCYSKNLTDQGIIESFYALNDEINKISNKERIWKLVPTYKKYNEYHGFIARCLFKD